MSTQIEILTQAWGLKDLIKIPRHMWVELSEFKGWSPEKQVKERDRIVVVVDGATWAVSNLPLDSLPNLKACSAYSGNEEIWGLYLQQRTFAVYTVGSEEGESGPIPVLNSSTVTTLYGPHNLKVEESFVMAGEEQKEFSADDLAGAGLGGDMADLEADLQAEADKAAADAETVRKAAQVMQDSASFQEGGSGDAGDGTTTTVAKKNPEAQLNEGIRTFVKETAVKNSARLDAVHAFNNGLGEALGYLTDDDRKLEARLTGVVRIGAGGQKELVSDAPETAVLADKNKKHVEAKYYKKDFKYTWKEVAPGKIQAVFFTIPLGGFVHFQELASATTEVKPDRDNKTLKIMAVPHQRALFLLPLYYGRLGIKESKKTHGDHASVLMVEGKLVDKTDKNGRTTPTTVKRLVPASKRRTLVVENNYLPTRTFKTVAITPTGLTPEAVALANFSLFGGFATAQTKQGEVKVKNLVADDRQLVNYEDPNNITSKFITANQAERSLPKVREFYDTNSDNYKAVLHVPIKELVQPADTTKAPRPRFVKIDIFDKDLDKNPDKALSSLEDPRFQTFREAIGEYANVEELRKLVGGPKKKETKLINSDVIAQMELAMLQGNQSFEGISLGVTTEQLVSERKALYSLQEELLSGAK